MVDLIMIIYMTLAVICLLGLSYALIRLIQHGEIAFVIVWTSGLVISLCIAYIGVILYTL